MAHEFKPYADNPDYCVAELPDSGDTCNRPREDHTVHWTVTDFKGNSVQFDGGRDLHIALDIAYGQYRVSLYGNAEHWEIVNSAGDRYPRESEYDWQVNEYGYER
ncbi:hypothetical protein [Mycobacterium sp. IS-836]|uniref:hypothetical protein n=1 Tax=Mycobacterium sp. IS-836 TaxID=1834160 RepID=UPI00114DCD1C|nr:hypothetical protein [Mycobacterium sp. IS-836]